MCVISSLQWEKETKYLQWGIIREGERIPVRALLDMHSEFPMKDIIKWKLPSIRFTVLFSIAPLEIALKCLSG